VLLLVAGKEKNLALPLSRLTSVCPPGARDGKRARRVPVVVSSSSTTYGFFCGWKGERGDLPVVVVL
jgi:hypothetical protein